MEAHRAHRVSRSRLATPARRRQGPAASQQRVRKRPLMPPAACRAAMHLRDGGEGRAQVHARPAAGAGLSAQRASRCATQRPSTPRRSAATRRAVFAFDFAGANDNVVVRRCRATRNAVTGCRVRGRRRRFTAGKCKVQDLATHTACRQVGLRPGAHATSIRTWSGRSCRVAPDREQRARLHRAGPPRPSATAPLAAGLPQDVQAASCVPWPSPGRTSDGPKLGKAGARGDGRGDSGLPGWCRCPGLACSRPVEHCAAQGRRGGPSIKDLAVGVARLPSVRASMPGTARQRAPARQTTSVPLPPCPARPRG